MSYRIPLLALFFTLMALAPGPTYAQVSECANILDDGIRDRYGEQTALSYNQMLERLLSHEITQLISSGSEDSFDLGVPVPVAEGFLNLSLGAGSNSDRLNKMRAAFQQKGLDAVSRDDYRWLTKSIASDIVVESWLRCMEITVASRPKGVMLDVEGDVGDEFALALTWTQGKSAESAPVVESLEFSRVEPRGTQVLASGTVLNNLQRKIQNFVRTDSGQATVTLHFRLHDDMNVILPEIRPRQVPEGITGTWRVLAVPPNTSVVICQSCAGSVPVHITRVVGGGSPAGLVPFGPSGAYPMAPSSGPPGAAPLPGHPGMMPPGMGPSGAMSHVVANRTEVTFFQDGTARLSVGTGAPRAYDHSVVAEISYEFESDRLTIVGPAPDGESQGDGLELYVRHLSEDSMVLYPADSEDGEIASLRVYVERTRP